MCRALALAAPIALPATPLRAQNPSNGPLTYEEGSPLHRVSYTPMTEGAELVPDGALAADVWLGYSNIFEQDSTDTHVLFLDLERLVTAVTVRWGATDRLELGGRLVLETTGSGALDGFISDWHDRFGFGQANRDRFPEDRYAQRLTDGDGTVFLDVPQRTLGFEGARLFAKTRIAGSVDGSDVLALKGELRLPGGSNPMADERADVALSALGRIGLGSWHLHALLGASTVRAAPELEPILRDATTFLTLALERSFGTFSALVQYQVQSPVMESFEHRELDRSPTNLVIGAAGKIGRSWAWDLSFQEDLPADSPAVDFTLGLRVTRVW